MGQGKTELIGMGDAGVWCVFAAAIAPVRLDLVADLNCFGGSDKDFHDRFLVPGIQRAGGLSVALGLVTRVQTLIPTPTQAQFPAGEEVVAKTGLNLEPSGATEP
jgi:hypothetical protein